MHARVLGVKGDDDSSPRKKSPQKRKHDSGAKKKGKRAKLHAVESSKYVAFIIVKIAVSTPHSSPLTPFVPQLFTRERRREDSSAW